MKNFKTIFSCVITGMLILLSSIVFAGCGDDKKTPAPPPTNEIKLVYSQDGKTLLGCPKDAIGDVVVKAGVKFIADDAFNGCERITSVTLPAGVETIEDTAFKDCANLDEIILPASLKSIGEDAFINCEELSIVQYKGDINQWCGIDFEELSSNPISYGVRFVYEGNATSEMQITTATTIRNYAFVNLAEFEKVTIGGTVKTIGKRAFANSSVKTFVLEEGVEIIGEESFTLCKMTQITLPSTIKSIGSTAFGGCDDLASVRYRGDVNDWCGIIFSNLASNPLYEDNTGKFLYINNQKVTTLNITTATKVNKYAFYNASGITSINIGSSVQTIEDYAFAYCIKVTQLNLSSGLQTIGEGAFYRNVRLHSVFIPSTVVTIKLGAFAYGPVSIDCESASKPAGWHAEWHNADYVSWNVAQPK